MNVNANPTWQQFFDSHAPHYSKNEFTKWTKTEVSFLLDLFPLPSGSKILDLGCGTGRHAVEFATRGFQVTGVDLSQGMLDEAQNAAEAAGVSVEWIKSDIRDFSADEQYDFVICLCEGGFGLIDAGENPVAHDLAILDVAFRSLKHGAPFVLNALNGYSVIRRLTDDHVAQGSFDPATMISQYKDTWVLPEGEKSMLITERLFIPPEVVAMLSHVGFEVDHIWGGTAGEWGRRPLKLDEVEMMIVAHKPN